MECGSYDVGRPLESVGGVVIPVGGPPNRTGTGRATSGVTAAVVKLLALPSAQKIDRASAKERPA